jgi:hypothetical protein
VPPNGPNGTRWERTILAILSGILSLLLIVLGTGWVNLKAELHNIDERQRDGLNRLRAVEIEIQQLKHEIQRLTR